VISSISEALELSPGSAEALSSLGLTYVMAWRWKDAWAMLSEAKARDPTLALTELGFALYYSGLGEVEKVKSSLAAANRLDPLNPELADWGQGPVHGRGKRSGPGLVRRKDAAAPEHG
jgi:tetratricopeptide (TPR) repeat protein